MNKIIIIIIILSIIFSNKFYSEENYDVLFDDEESNNDLAADNSTLDNSLPQFELSLLGDHGFEFHIPLIKDHLDFKGDIKAPRFNNDLGIELSYKILKLIAHWQIDAKLNEFGSVEDVLLVKPLENSITLSPWCFNIRAGYQYFTWGTADGINPTDNINPGDYRRGIDEEKLSVLSAYIGFNPVDFLLIEAVYVPFEQKDIFPVADSDIIDEVPEQLFYGMSATFPPLTFTPVPHTKDVNIKNPDFDPSSFILGGKINFFFQYIDFSFSYLYDIDSFYTPVINMKHEKVKNTPNPPIPALYLYRVDSIDLIKKRLHRFGADFKVNIDRFGIWGEICYTMSEDYLQESYKTRNHNISWVAGFDFNYGPNDDFYFNIQYLGECNPFFDTTFYNDYEDGMPDKDNTDNETYMEQYYYRMFTNYLGGVTAGLIQGVSLKMEWSTLDALLTPSISMVYMIPLLYDYDHDFKYGSFAVNPELDIMPIDSLHVLIGVDLYYSWHRLEGESVDIDYNDQLGVFFNDCNIYLELRYKWSFTWKK